MRIINASHKHQIEKYARLNTELLKKIPLNGVTEKIQMPLDRKRT